MDPIIRIFKDDNIDEFKSWLELRDTNHDIIIEETINDIPGQYPLDLVITKYHAAECLKYYERSPKGSGFTSLHLAFKDNWQQGIEILFKYKHLLYTFDKSKKSPLAYFADQQNIETIPLVIKLITKHDCKNALKHVHGRDMTFVQYCIANKLDLMTNALSAFIEAGLIEEKSFLELSFSKSSDPSLSKLFRETAKYSLEYKLKLWMQPDCYKSNRFSPTYLVGKNVEQIQAHLNNLIYLSNMLRTDMKPLPSNVSEDKIIDHLLQFEAGEQRFLNYYINSDYLKIIYEDVKVNSIPYENDTFIIPNNNIDFWYRFGFIFGLVCVSGSYLEFPYKLSPLFYDKIVNKNTKLDSGTLIDYIKGTDPKLYSKYLKSKQTEFFKKVNEVNPSGDVIPQENFMEDFIHENIPPEIISSQKFILDSLGSFAQGFLKFKDSISTVTERGRIAFKMLEIIEKNKLNQIPMIWFEGLKIQNFYTMDDNFNDKSSESIFEIYKDLYEIHFVCEKGDKIQSYNFAANKKAIEYNSLSSIESIHKILLSYGGIHKCLPLAQNIIKFMFILTNSRRQNIFKAIKGTDMILMYNPSDNIIPIKHHPITSIDPQTFYEEYEILF
ncbi:hypothetical protein TVAG_395500 [Trichomonas vaginalis G3]|uniref:Uncharacterized protein n=1 Tax=Trichomonas vaginalis (strain ATCC PRA-98 / G3) TaxID=412133 RepID=A2F1D9_TRIV3|nr:Ankyrin repeat family [Trichomonas vaginalis G3]EAY01303.1 hypothetical protein TVAG_395500 [Trichomonas vaginalis G3]KAI5542833.1 Ankyrin repeat family [Trichomonas vaginalis G3]|eukprot:XP_001330171.1 hypothetical protein [Trichomonas vaginalis G3]